MIWRSNPVILRTLLGLLATCLIAALIWWALASTDATVQTASSLQGERWYRLTLADNAVGYYRSKTHRNQSGEHAFETELRFALSAEQPVSVRESYRFAAAAPYQLIAASHQVTRRSGTQAVHIQAGPEGLLAQRKDSETNNNAPQPPAALDWNYTLGDYLAFESWIREHTPAAGDSIRVASPNLDTLVLSEDVFELVTVSPQRYEVRKRSLLEDTVIELDQQLVPVRFELAGIFNLERSTRLEALSARTPLQKSSYRLPLNKPLQQPNKLVRLELRASGSSAAEFPQPLVLTANPVVPAKTGSYLNASLELPVQHPQLQQVLSRLNLGNLDTEQQVQRLLTYVHEFIEYDASVQSRGVLELLQQPSGDCTEFADLFTSLARTAGIPARTVVGMAYSEDPDPALAFHAWNQVQIKGVWEAVDPTWNQRQVDATHWPLPSSTRQSMLLLTGQMDVRLEVLRADYASERPNSAI